MFNEICIYEAKIEKQDEIEALMKEVAEFYLSLPGVIDVKYIKRTHRQKDFNAVKAGEPPTTIETTEDGDLITIEYPLEGFSPEKLENLIRLVAAKETLLRQSLGTEDLSIHTTDNAILFPWFRSLAPEAVKAHTVLVERLCKTALEKRRVTAKEKSFPNPHYALRCFLLSLGMIGDEFKIARRILLSRLEGNSSWKNGAPAKAKLNLIFFTPF